MADYEDTLLKLIPLAEKLAEMVPIWIKSAGWNKTYRQTLRAALAGGVDTHTALSVAERAANTVADKSDEFKSQIEKLAEVDP